jgi:hypothetical protein
MGSRVVIVFQIWGFRMGIHIIEGLPGHGKSTYATILASEWQAYYVRHARRPRRIYANFEMYLPCLVCSGVLPECSFCGGSGRGVEFVEDFLELRTLTDAIVIIDEAPQWFSGHESRQNAKFMGFFSQHRKDGNTLFLIAQSWSSLDLTVRERTCESVHRVKRFFGPNRWEEPSLLEQAFGWWAMAIEYQARDYDTATKKICKGRRLFRIDTWHGKFDTLAKVGHIGERGGRGVGLAAGSAVDPDSMRGESVKLASEVTEEILLQRFEQAQRRERAATALVRSASTRKRVISGYRDYVRGVAQVDPFGICYRYRADMDEVIDLVVRGRDRDAA